MDLKWLGRSTFMEADLGDGSTGAGEGHEPEPSAGGQEPEDGSSQTDDGAPIAPPDFVLSSLRPSRPEPSHDRGQQMPDASSFPPGTAFIPGVGFVPLQALLGNGPAAPASNGLPTEAEWAEDPNAAAERYFQARNPARESIDRLEQRLARLEGTNQSSAAQQVNQAINESEAEVTRMYSDVFSRDPDFRTNKAVKDGVDAQIGGILFQAMQAVKETGSPTPLDVLFRNETAATILFLAKMRAGVGGAHAPRSVGIRGAHIDGADGPRGGGQATGPDKATQEALSSLGYNTSQWQAARDRIAARAKRGA